MLINTNPMINAKIHETTLLNFISPPQSPFFPPNFFVSNVEYYAHIPIHLTP